MVDIDTTEEKTYSMKNKGWYRVVRGAIGVLVRLLTRTQVRGLEHVPEQGPYLLVTNHLHWLDSPLIAVAFPYRPYVFVGEKWAKHLLLGPLFRSLDAIFVQRGEVDRNALRKALAVLGGGGILGLAPEGTRSKTGGLQRGRTGAAYMALRAGVKVVPIAITGEAAVFKALKHLRRAQVRVVFGPAFEPPIVPADQRPSAAQAHDFTEEIMYRLAAMLPPEYRGAYRDVTAKRPELLAIYSTGHEPGSNER